MIPMETLKNIMPQELILQIDTFKSMPIELMIPIDVLKKCMPQELMIPIKTFKKMQMLIKKQKSVYRFWDRK